MSTRSGRESAEQRHFCSLFPSPIGCFAQLPVQSGKAQRHGAAGPPGKGAAAEQRPAGISHLAAPQFPPGRGRASPAAVQHRPRGSARFRRDEGPRRRAERSGGGGAVGGAALRPRARATAPAGPYVPPPPGPAPGRSPPRTRSAARPRSGPRAAAAGPAPAPPPHPPRPPRRRPRPAPVAPWRCPRPAAPPPRPGPAAGSHVTAHRLRRERPRGAGGEGASGAESRTTAGGVRSSGAGAGSGEAPSERLAAPGRQHVVRSAEHRMERATNSEPLLACKP